MIGEQNFKFFHEVESLVKKYNISWLDAILEYASMKNIEPEMLSSSIEKHPALLARIQEEAEDLHFLPKHERLPIYDDGI